MCHNSEQSGKYADYVYARVWESKESCGYEPAL